MSSSVKSDVEKLSLPDRERFTIGDVVLVCATVERGCFSGERIIVRRPMKALKAGQIVGIRRIFEGTITTEVYDGEGVNTSYLNPTSSEEVWLVRFGMKNREYMVRDEDLIIDSYALEGKYLVPILDGNWYSWTERDLAELRELVKEQSRDSKGRWVKK
jgi:hypothetical protein